MSSLNDTHVDLSTWNMCCWIRDFYPEVVFVSKRIMIGILIL